MNNTNLLELRNLLDDNCVDFCYSDLIEAIDDDFTELADELEDIDCDSCIKCAGYVDPQDLHSDLIQLDASYALKQVSEETYLYCKNILEQYVTI